MRCCKATKGAAMGLGPWGGEAGRGELVIKPLPRAVQSIEEQGNPSCQGEL